MNKEFIEAEKIWEDKIQAVFDEYFNMFLSDIEWMAKLSLLIDDRMNEYREDETIFNLYLKLSLRIISWSENNLNEDDYYRFCKISNNQSIIEVKKIR